MVFQLLAIFKMVCSVSQLKTQLSHTALQSSYMCIMLSQIPTLHRWISCVLSLHCVQNPKTD